jgi:hypothetical protein
MGREVVRGLSVGPLLRTLGSDCLSIALCLTDSPVSLRISDHDVLIPDMSCMCSTESVEPIEGQVPCLTVEDDLGSVSVGHAKELGEQAASMTTPSG